MARSKSDWTQWSGQLRPELAFKLMARSRDRACSRGSGRISQCTVYVGSGFGGAQQEQTNSLLPLPVIGGFTQDEGVALGANLSSGTLKGRSTLNMDERLHGILLCNGVNHLPADCWTAGLPCISKGVVLLLQNDSKMTGGCFVYATR